ncbi:DNA polymerase sliding clamp [Salinigranum salinum]|uniref:DNA polymerase sliding clamp n=1 Tax=Salinigranum salinum TaxID=1364937 RepID=UPI0012607DFB|nr:DNA polymerase sliding clamp [Salinigranum salinum]
MSTDSDTEPDREPEPAPEQPETEPPTPADDDGESTPNDHPESTASPVDEDSTEETTPADGVPDEPPASFRATIQAAHLKIVLSSLRALVDEARIRVTEDGLTVRAVDSANVAMDDLELKAAAFESFEASPGTLGLNLDRLADPVRLASKDDLVQLFLDPESGKLIVVVDGLRYSMACIDSKTIRAEPTLPEFDLPVVVTVDRDVLQRGVKAADLVADHVRLRMEAGADALVIKAEGDADAVTLELDGDDIEVLAAGDASTLFSLDYCKKLVRTIPAGTPVTLDLGEDFPLILSYELADGDGTITRMLAPRIET